MNSKELRMKFIDDLNLFIKTKSNVINAVKSLEIYNYFIVQQNSIFDYIYKWYKLEYPELYNKVNKNNSEYIKNILEMTSSNIDKESIIKETLGESALNIISNLCNCYLDIEKNIKKIKKFIEKQAKIAYPNLSAVIGPIIATKMVSQIGSLERLSKMPSSTIQLIGAEKALFKHLRFNKKSPKYGFLYQHPIMSKLNNKQKGKLARFIANKLFLATKLDFNKQPLDISLLQQIEDKKKELSK